MPVQFSHDVLAHVFTPRASSFEMPELRARMASRTASLAARATSTGRHSAALARLDSNGDGQLTRDEVLAHSRTRFDRLDANGDGLVSPDEYGARLVNMFARMDTNRNGILEGDELPRRMKKGGHHKGHMKTPGADS